MYLSDYDLTRLAHERIQAYLTAAKGDAVAREQRRAHGNRLISLLAARLPSSRKRTHTKRFGKARL